MSNVNRQAWGKDYYKAHKEDIRAKQTIYNEANKEKARAYYKANTEKTKAYYQSHKERFLERAKARQLANPGMNTIKMAEWRKANPEKAKMVSKDYYKKNKEKIHAQNSAWKNANPEQIKRYRHERRAKKNQSEIEKFLVIEIFERDRWICQLCKKKVNKRLKYPDLLSATLDHIIPFAKGGSHSRANTQLAHMICNSMAGVNGIKQLRMAI